MVLGVIFPTFILLRVCSVYWNCGLMSFYQFWNILSHYQTIASVPFYLSSPSGAPVPCMLDISLSHMSLSCIFHYFCSLSWKYFSAYFLWTYLPIHKSSLQTCTIICEPSYWVLDFSDCIFPFLNFQLVTSYSLQLSGEILHLSHFLEHINHSYFKVCAWWHWYLGHLWVSFRWIFVHLALFIGGQILCMKSWRELHNVTFPQSRPALSCDVMRVRACGLDRIRGCTDSSLAAIFVNLGHLWCPLIPGLSPSVVPTKSLGQFLGLLLPGGLQTPILYPRFCEIHPPLSSLVAFCWAGDWWVP